MSNSNNDNPKIGRAFQEKVRHWFSKDRKENFVLEYPVHIGKPARPHNFDVANETGTTVIECKCYAWTDSGNVPSAKLRGLNEAVFYFSFLPKETEKILVMAHAVHPKKSESLAEFYVRTNNHLLGDVKVWEFDVISGEMKSVQITKESVQQNDSVGKVRTAIAIIRQHIINKKIAAREEGKTSITIVARDIHNEMNLKNSYPSVCNAMRQCMSGKDIIVRTPPKGNSSTFEVEYFL
jgi:hypothetical protein